MLLRSMTLSFN